jgi:putative transposase
VTPLAYVRSMGLPGSHCRSYRFRLHPTLRQIQSLELQLRYQCELYNAALEERKGAWEWERRSVSYIDQCRTLNGLIEVRPEVMTSGVALCRGTLRRLDRAFSTFYSRIKSGQTPGFPHFKPSSRFDSLEWQDRHGWKLKMECRRLYVQGIGDVKANYYRPVVGIAKAITIKREGSKWWLHVHCTDVPVSPLMPTGRDVGLDLGVANLVATSDGRLIEGQQFGAKEQGRLSKAQRELATKQRGSKRRRQQVEKVAAIHRRAKNQRTNAAHHLSKLLVADYDHIFLEDLRITNMVRTPKAKPDPATPGGFLPNGAAVKSRLNRSIHDAGWGQLLSQLSYKAESAGRTVVAVGPCYTSQTCAECGHTDVGNRVNQATFRCQKCGHHDHADLNAARNILRAGRARLASASNGQSRPLPGI